MKASFRPSLLTLFLAAFALFAQVVLCEFQYSVTGTHNGVPIPESEIQFEPYTPSVHRLKSSITGPQAPPTRGHKNKNRAEIRDTTHSLLKRNPVAYSGDWCGAASSTVSTDKITNVQGYFQVPSPTLRAGSGSPQYVGAWIGLDGNTWSTALLQAGTASAVATGGSTTYWAWLEWVPSAAYNIPSFPVSPGDWIYVSITPTSSTSANLTIENYSQSYSYTVVLTGGATLGQVDAEWIIEDPYGSSGQVPFPEFGTVWFENVYATTSNGSRLDVDTSTMIYLDNPPVCEAAEYSTYDFYAWSI